MDFGSINIGSGHPVIILLDDDERQDGSCLLLERPKAIIECHHPQDVEASLEAVNDALHQGFYAAGFFAYELGYVLEPSLARLCPARRQQPLIWLGIFDRLCHLSADETKHWLADRAGLEWSISGMRASLDRERYTSAFRSIQDYIASGDVYQINFTFQYLFEFTGNPFALYQDLRRSQRVAHGGMISAPDFHILSLSPELFLRVRQRNAHTRPMKGTAPRGLTLKEDRTMRTWLRRDPKSRAENLMIVDLLRNDLGRLAEVGSVRVSELFAVETYRTVHQMTSCVQATLRSNVKLRELLSGLFPCGSVTGAPKIRAMEIIHELEAEPRGPYTGAVGLLAPNGDAAFNVAIRTLTIAADGRGVMGIGSGIVHDSDAESEYDECLLKARFLTHPPPDFSLIETMRWDVKGGYYLLQRHLNRLAASAEYFDFLCDVEHIKRALDRHAFALSPDTYKVRLLVDGAGQITITHELLAPETAQSLTFTVSRAAVASGDPFQYHKTTNRGLYDREWACLHQETGCDEVVFVNERGELTEGTRTNIFLERNGRLLTPPLSSGLLDGTLRRELLETRPQEVFEEIVTPADLAAADHVLLGNSVRGLRPARLLSNRPV
ncbi:MAG: aminodeoxychorismate synthase component I [Hyphomicrobiales bacterium]|nr:aminodeoxychorismate synthase component I [Hyphomicrobiales bacterium]